jgi:uroporphyrinogen decarboxylase
MALAHDEPDRVPIDFGGSRVSGVAAVAYRRLLDSLHMDERIRLYDIKQQLALPSPEMIARMGGDIAQITRIGPTTGMPFLRIDRWEDGTLTDGTPCLVPEGYDPVFRENGDLEIHRDGMLYARRPSGALYFDVVTAPLAHAETLEDIDAYEWPDPWSEREDAYLASEIDRLYHGTDLALFGGLPLYDCSFVELGQTMFGFENLLVNLMLKRDMMEHWLDRVLEHHLATLDRFLAITGPYLAAIQMNDDLGTQDNLLLPPDLYRDMIKPRQAAWIERARSLTDAKIFLHCDGAVEDILDDFIEIGIEILNPLQSGARGMDPAGLKQRYGDRLSFWGGGVDTQTTLPFGSVDDIRTEVRERIELLGPGGGYIFATIHNIQADIPPEKITAIFDTARDAGQQ